MDKKDEQNDQKPSRADYLKDRAAAVTKSDDTPTEVPEVGESADIEFDLTTIEDEEVRGGVKAILDRAKAAQKAARDLAKHGIQQSIRVKALELASELELADQVGDIEALLKGVKTPKELDIRVREVRLDLLNDSVPGKKADDDKSHADEDGKGEGKERVFDEGRGRGSNFSRELAKKIDEIDPNDPDAQKELDKLYADVTRAQERYSARK